MAQYAEGMIVDKKEQLEKIESICLPDETILAVFDLKGGGTGFLGITDKRIIFYDKAFLSRKKAWLYISEVFMPSFSSPSMWSIISCASSGGASALSSECLSFCSEKGSTSPEAFIIFTVFANLITPLVYSVRFNTFALKYYPEIT